MTWKELAERGDQLGNVVKPIALILAVGTFLGLSSPWLRRQWEEWTAPSAWYQIGTLHDPRGRVPFTSWEGNEFASMIWKNGLRTGSLYNLGGHTIITTGLVYGHEARDAASDISAVHRADICLYVDRLVLRPFLPTTPTEFNPDVRQSDLSTTDWHANQDFLAKEVSAPAGCLDASQDGLRDTRPSSTKPAGPICPRIQVWVEAKKVTC